MKRIFILFTLAIGLAAAAPAQVGRPVAGFRISPEAADVPLGNNVIRKSDLGLDKWIGDQGVFATNPVTGSERFIPNSTSPVLRRDPLAVNAEEHNRLAVEYFTARGLPSDQIGFVRALTQMTSDGQTGTAMETKKASFAGYLTVITRAIDGIGVPDSFAAVRFNQDGVPTMLWKYWPEIPQSAVDEARALRAAASEADASRGPIVKLPAELRSAPSEVTIRHSDFDFDTAQSSFHAFASLDVHQERGERVLRARTRHFDINGAELIHPNQRAAQSAATPDSVKLRYPK